MLEFIVDDNTVLRKYDSRPYQYKVPMYSQNAIEVLFEFDETWNGYTTTAQLTKLQSTYNLLLDANNKILIPSDITEGLWYISVFGVKGSVTRNTTISACINVVRGGYVTSGTPPVPPTPDLYQQLISQVETSEANAKASEVAAAQSLQDVNIASTAAISKMETYGDTRYANALIGNKSGTLVNVDDAWGVKALKAGVDGKSAQDGTPTPDAPVEIINVTSPVRIRTHDGVFYINHSGGLFDWSITNADNLTWYFPDGTTSNAVQPSRTIDAGTVKAVCDDWTKRSMEINDNDTNSAFVGDLSDLPPVTNYLNMYGCSNLTGNIADLPPVTIYLILGGCSKLTGNIADLPPVTNRLSIYNCSKLTGNIADLPPATNYLNMGGCPLLTGVLSVAGTVKEIYLQGTGMSASDTDQTLINLAATTTVTSGGILQIKKNRTSESDAAFAYLSSRFTITEV